MSDEVYSNRQFSRFSLEHRHQCPSIATMIDLDQIMWLPYVPGGKPAMVVELKPENAKEDFWHVTQRLGRMAGIPAAKIIDRKDGLYTVWVATAENDWKPMHIGSDLTITDWYERVELPYRTVAS